jgi:hypothetical protein
MSAYEKQKEAHKYDFNYFYGIKLLLNRLAKNGSYEHERIVVGFLDALGDAEK